MKRGDEVKLQGIVTEVRDTNEGVVLLVTVSESQGAMGVCLIKESELKGGDNGIVTKREVKEECKSG